MGTIATSGGPFGFPGSGSGGANADGQSLLSAAMCFGPVSARPSLSRSAISSDSTSFGATGWRRSSHSTNSAMTATDVVNTQNSLGAKYQTRASWVSSLTYQNRVRAFGTNFWGQTQDFSQNVSSAILGKSSYEASDMSTALSSVTNPAFVYGDFSNGFVIADRVGMAVEFVPLLMSTGNGLPNGKRGWYVHYRNGSDVVNNTAFVLSVNPGA